MVTYRTAQQQMNDVLTFGMSLMFMGLMFGLVKPLISTSLEPERKPSRLLASRLTPSLLPATVPQLAPIPELDKRLAAVSELLPAMSLYEIVGWTKAESLVRKTRRGLEKQKWDWMDARDEASSLEHDPFGTVESWLQPGGFAQKHPVLHEVAQTVIEAAEAKARRALESLPQEAIDDINYRISLRTAYGVRKGKADAPGTVIVWSNASSDWYDSRVVRKGELLTLDANQVFVPYPRRRVSAALHRLDPLPLYRYSYESIARKKEEAKRLGIEGSRESDERWLDGLRMLGLAVYVEPGYAGSTPAPLVADVPDLEHIGGGNLSDGKRVFRLRINPETGTRFYVAEDLATWTRS